MADRKKPTVKTEELAVETLANQLLGLGINVGSIPVTGSASAPAPGFSAANHRPNGPLTFQQQAVAIPQGFTNDVASLKRCLDGRKSFVAQLKKLFFRLQEGEMKQLTEEVIEEAQAKVNEVEEELARVMKERDTNHLV